MGANLRACTAVPNGISSPLKRLRTRAVISIWVVTLREIPVLVSSFLQCVYIPTEDTRADYFGPIAGVRRHNLSRFNEHRYLD